MGQLALFALKSSKHSSKSFQGFVVFLIKKKPPKKPNIFIYRLDFLWSTVIHSNNSTSWHLIPYFIKFDPAKRYGQKFKSIDKLATLLFSGTKKKQLRKYCFLFSTPKYDVKSYVVWALSGWENIFFCGLSNMRKIKMAERRKGTRTYVTYLYQDINAITNSISQPFIRQYLPF